MTNKFHIESMSHEKYYIQKIERGEIGGLTGAGTEPALNARSGYGSSNLNNSLLNFNSTIEDQQSFVRIRAGISSNSGYEIDYLTAGYSPSSIIQQDQIQNRMNTLRGYIAVDQSQIMAFDNPLEALDSNSSGFDSARYQKYLGQYNDLLGEQGRKLNVQLPNLQNTNKNVFIAQKKDFSSDTHFFIVAKDGSGKYKMYDFNQTGTSYFAREYDYRKSNVVRWQWY